jgi:hypothetical protein
LRALADQLFVIINNKGARKTREIRISAEATCLNGVGENFYDFVNKYRVDGVKRLMTDPQATRYGPLLISPKSQKR